MSKLHYDRVRRARRLPVPLPQKKKDGPFGPRVLWYWRDTAIRMRSDVEKAGTWEEFLDDMASSDGLNFMDAGWCPRGYEAVMALTPHHERPFVGADFRQRVRSARERQAETVVKASWGPSFRDLFWRSA